MSNCQVCLATIKKNHLKLSCEDCAANFHAKCVKMTQADLEYLEQQGSTWRCDPCSTTRRKSMRMECNAQEGSLTLQDIMGVLTDIQEGQKKTVSEFNKSYETLHEKLEENTKTLSSEMEKIADYMKIIDDLRNENATLKNKVSLLENRVEDLESYSRRNCLELQGIPEKDGENVLDIVKKVGEALGVEIVDTMIDACHRVGQKLDGRGPRGVIVKMVRRIDKETLLQKRREKKKDFSTRHLGFPTDTAVYLNESLSPTKRRLLGQARQAKKDKGYKYVWLRNGNILLRKEEGSPAIEIRNQADLSKL